MTLTRKLQDSLYDEDCKSIQKMASLQVLLRFVD